MLAYNSFVKKFDDILVVPLVEGEEGDNNNAHDDEFFMGSLTYIIGLLVIACFLVLRKKDSIYLLRLSIDCILPIFLYLNHACS